MLIHIPKFIPKEKISEIKALLHNASYADGKETAGEIAVKVKNNLQLIGNTEIGSQVDKIIRQIVLNDKRFWNITFFEEVLPFNFSLYETGMHYGLHLDNPVMHNAKIRTDISMTIHLNSPTAYEGGELIIHSDYGVHTCKAEEGDAIVYPSHLLHEVKPVTSGQRLVAITWIQSAIRDPQRRRVLVDMMTVISNLENETPNRLTAQKCFNSLLRMWLNS